MAKMEDKEECLISLASELKYYGSVCTTKNSVGGAICEPLIMVCTYFYEAFSVIFPSFIINRMLTSAMQY